MPCQDYTSAKDAFLDFALFDAIWCVFVNTTGMWLFSSLIFGGLGVTLYVYTGSMLLVSVLTMIAGAIIVTQLPTQIATMAGIVVLFIVTIGGYIVVEWLDRP